MCHWRRGCRNSKELEFLRERHDAAKRIFVFRHALTREVAYDGMLQARRRDLHGRAGAALEKTQASRFEHCELLAYHYSHSGDPQRAIPYLASGRRPGQGHGTPTRRPSRYTAAPSN